MRRGLEWYKREPRAFLDGCRAAKLTERQLAIYTIIIDLIYDHGGETPDDPKHIASYLSDIGTAAVRNTIQQLVDKGKLFRVGDMLHQERAENQAQTREKLSETRANVGRFGGVSSGISRRAAKEINRIDEANASSKPEAEKRREEIEEREAKASPKNAKPGKLHIALAEATGIEGWAVEDTSECLTIWLALGLTPDEIIDTARIAAAQSTTPIAGPRALDRAMSEAATAKRRPKPKADPKGTRLPEEWELPRPWGVWALQAGLTIPEVREQGARFKDYWHGVPGAKGRKADWEATWRNWIRRVIEERSTGGRNGRTGTTGLSEGGQRPDPALANIARLAGLGEAPGDGGGGAGGAGEEAGQVRLGS